MSIKIGIDTGKNTGLAMWNGKTFDVLRLTDFWGAYNLVIELDKKTTEVHIEVPRTKANWQKSKHSITSANIGGLYRESHLLADGIEKNGFKVFRHHPKGKVDKKTFERITGYKGRTNEHTRDAGMLVYGM